MNKLMAVIGVTAAMLTASAATPAYAAASDCPVDNFCIWTATNYSGSRFQYTKTTLVNGVNNGIRLTSGISNRGYSFYNHLSGASWKVNIYDSGNCAQSPWFRTMTSGQQATAQGSDWGGRVSSIQLTNASPLTC
jgi:hypothetical protein